MPKRNQERIGRFANIQSACFLCPHCGGSRGTFERELQGQDLLCRHCQRWFTPLAYAKDYLLCDACRHRLETVHYREAHRILRLCADCATDFDRTLAQLELARNAVVRTFCHERRAKLKLVGAG